MAGIGATNESEQRTMKKRKTPPVRPEKELQRVLDELSGGKLQEASARAQRAVERWPQNAKAWLLKALTADANGQNERAQNAARRSLELNPQDPQAHNFYGLLAVRRGMLNVASVAFSRALTLAPEFPQALNNMGNLKRGQGDLTEAARLYRKALEVAPEYADAQVNLSLVLSTQGQPEAAESCARRAYELGLTAASAFRLGVVLKEKGDREAAIAALKEAVACDPSDHRGAGLLLAGLGAAPAPERPPTDYVRQLFDGIAEGYDAHLESDLSYRGPAVLDSVFETAAGDPKDLEILDLGCGTGLLAAALKHRATRIDGVDLSPAMIEKARERDVYDTLTVGEIDAYMSSSERQYGAVVAADVLMYLGD
ncbi:MAG: putative TPR repeat methyltransferase, partial [Myxococcota bacterium]